MITRTYNPQYPYQVVFYLRFSDPKQNKRSPEQQDATIREVMRRCANPWTVVRIYRDDGIKARYIKRRPGLQQLLRDIAVGIIRVDLIVVDTFERFGRAEEFEAIRRKLMVEYGVLIVSADNNFADPTGVVGKAVGMVEQIRSTEDGRVKAHNVIRGKKDTLRLKRWPGGPVPLGYRLKKLIDHSGGEPEVYSVLEPDPESAPVIRKIFQKAFETGWGGTRLAKWFNADPTVPDKFKPFYAPSIDYWLESEIYIGVGVWGANCTDIINDARVIEPNPHPDEVLRVEGFCEPLVSNEVFKAIQEVREARRAARAARMAAAAAPETQKLIQPIAGGISVHYPLAGLVKCSACGACMIPRASGRRSKTGTKYTYYVCPRYIDGACTNDHYAHTGRLWEAVAACIRLRMFPPGDRQDVVPDWFAPLVERVRRELESLRQDRPRRSEDLMKQIRAVEQQMAGWRDSLGKRDLPPVLRQDLEQAYEKAAQDKGRLEAELTAEQALERQVQTTLDPRQVLDGLKRLSAVLMGHNVTLLNLELAKHVLEVACHADGRVILRGTFLGVFEGAVELLSRPMPPAADGAGAVSTPEPSKFERVKPRRLARRKVDDWTGDQPLAGDSQVLLDPHRYDGLAGEFVWEEPLALPRALPWAQENALTVLRYTQENPNATQEQVALHFGKTRPTIRHALKLAEAMLMAGSAPAEGGQQSVEYKQHDASDADDGAGGAQLDGNQAA